VRSITHPVTVGFGLANLYLIAMTGPLIAPDHDLVYHLIGAASTIFIPIIALVVVLWLALTALLYFAEQPRRLSVVIWSALILVLPWVLLETFADLFEVDVPEWLSRVLGFSVLFAVAAIAVFAKQLLPGFLRVRPVVAYVLGFMALSGCWIFAQLVWCGWQARDLNPPPGLHQTSVPHMPRQRIIWILLDELSYKQVYEQRFAGLELPALDRLAAESTVFTHAVPTGEFTRYIVPSLMTGVPADGVQVSAAGMLLSTYSHAAGSTNFDQRKTVFQDAIDAGYKTGLNGWYNPYCRILPAVLDKCFWTYHEGIPGNLSPDHTVWKNMGIPLRLIRLSTRHFFNLGTGAPSEELLDLQMHSTDYRDLMAAGDRMLRDPSINFLFVHMPIPHPYGFYDRRTRTFPTTRRSYIDNLALADLYMAHVRELLESTGQWDSSVVVVMGDHSWRTDLIWKSSAGWTEEDEMANHGDAFDDRPAYIVKLANQHTGERVDERFDAIRTRTLMGALMQGRVKTVKELKGWVGAQK
jgi:Sulfatase